ncbi:HAD hydrolase family protein [Demequina sp. SYSU T00039]|uniref:HAD hydrolase family protein n=1 Tax=Demequina lignilytica TaxID=3051663 RepID=A0AAW7M876_9MICO|nr:MULTISPECIES: HAD hydrolase family protein [unclassified Demequina]MDN4478387.1 HAD hydrolase family protein [Demequina sp. SYSU T00039-1]MDN4487106.1 HAD hydrolase family protein [Demequina sp. SYSU T00039]MDN4489817.1 HAD hydrolase family protein [Demequina sp. SYSU T00068]
MTPATSRGTAAGASSRRAVFLDIDGTYAHHGVVPPEHARAVRDARAAGHLVFLSTGRPVSMIPASIRAAGFDGMVASAGAHVLVGDRVLADVRFPEPLATRAREVLDRHGATYVLEAGERNHTRPGVIEALRERWEARLRAAGIDPSTAVGLRDVLASMEPRESLAGVAFSKITCFGGRTPITEVVEEIGPEVAALPSSVPDMGDGAGEIYLASLHKAVGVDAVRRHLGLDRAAIVAVGDGPNDVEMLEYAALGIAIEDGHPRAIAAADRTTPSPTRGGIATLFEELGLA